MMTKKGPNDARHVVWALCEFFFYSSSFYLLLTNVSFSLHPQKRHQQPQRVEMTHWGLPLTYAGHNDPQQVITTRWGFSFGLHPQRWNKHPQQVILTRWGLGKFFFLFYLFYVDTNLCFIYSSDRICDRVGNRNENSWQWRKRAQMTLDVLFGSLVVIYILYIRVLLVVTIIFVYH